MNNIALSQSRHMRNYACEVYCRPIITTVDTSASTNSNVSTTTTTSDTISGDDITVDQIVAGVGIITTLTATTLTATTINTTFIDSFTVPSGEDVRFIGTDTDSDIFWDASRDTLYTQTLKINDCFLYIDFDKDESDLTAAKAEQEKGIVFQWYDNINSESKKGFLGFNSNTERLSFNPNITITNDCTIEAVSEAYGDMEIQDVYLRNIINENISNNMSITSVSDITIESTDDLTINSGGNFSSLIDGNYDLGITGDYTIDVVGQMDLVVNGTSLDPLVLENTNGSVSLISGSSNSDSIYIHSENSGLKIESSGGDMTMETSNDLVVNTDGGTNMTLNDTAGLSVNVSKTDYLHWIPYYKFDAISGIWSNARTVPSSNPIYGWIKDTASETVQISTDIDISSRTTTDKGYKLTSVFFSYQISVQDITSITPRLTLKTFDSLIPSGGVTLTDVPYTDSNLTTNGLNVAEHYRSVDITTPFYINDESVLSVEIELTTQANSVFEFYGIHLVFDRNTT
jgi:hypothetical protein